jgi:hypothetical protein
MDYEGNVIRADKLLEFVREVVTEYAVKQILHNGIAGELSPLTKFYILWRWSFREAKVEFDEARKLAQSIGRSFRKRVEQRLHQKRERLYKSFRTAGKENRRN